MLKAIGDPSADVVSPLLSTVLDDTCRSFIRRACARTLEFLCRQASEPELATASRMGGSLVGIPQETVPNRLFEQRDAIIRHLSAGFSPLLNLIMTMAPSKRKFGRSVRPGNGWRTRRHRQLFISHAHRLSAYVNFAYCFS